MIGSSRRAVVAVVLAWGCAARADGNGAPPTEAQVEAARGIYHEARELQKQGRVAEALDKAMEAYRTAPTPVTALEAGGLLVDVGRLVEARDLMRGVAQLPISPRESDKGRGARQEAATLAASLDARIPKIAIAGRPAAMDVLLDGKPLAGDATAWQGVDPGPHTIVARDGERTCTTVTITLNEREERTIDVHDAATTCRPRATPQPPSQPPPQPPTQTRTPPLTPPPTPTPPLSASAYLALGLAGAGVIAIAAGGVVALNAKSDYDSVAADCPARGCTRDAFDVRTSARSRADAAGIVMIVGAAAIAGGAAILLWPRGPAQVAVGAGDVRLRVRF